MVGDPSIGPDRYREVPLDFLKSACAFISQTTRSSGKVDRKHFLTPEELIPGLLELSGIQAFAPVFGV